MDLPFSDGLYDLLRSDKSELTASKSVLASTLSIPPVNEEYCPLYKEKINTY